MTTETYFIIPEGFVRAVSALQQGQTPQESNAMYVEIAEVYTALHQVAGIRKVPVSQLLGELLAMNHRMESAAQKGNAFCEVEIDPEKIILNIGDAIVMPSLESTYRTAQARKILRVVPKTDTAQSAS